ncbi:MAG: NAD(P)/FAD-dependent oxidoreductase [Gammaproteobacteria bacterium]|nr:NAD(P)/FAD-dependent oxidoreductase [Gammaproteobacteria bacterium]
MTSGSGKHLVIVGGGTAGITVAATLMRKAGGTAVDITLIDPSDVHYYQPAFTLVGAGTFRLDHVQRREESLIPRGVEWIRDRVKKFEPDQNRVQLKSGSTMAYDYLVVCPGLELNWEKIQGAKEALGKNGVCSNYSPDHAEYTWSCIQNLKAGDVALYTQAPLPFKCPGAPQKAAYLGAHYLQKRGILKDCQVQFLTHAPVMFSVPFFSRELDKIVARYGIQPRFQHNLVAVDWQKKAATFEIVGGDKQGQKLTLAFNMLHMTPPQSPPESVRTSPLANAAGFVDVHHKTLQHIKYSNVFGLGDAAATPNSKTAAAVRKQAPVVVRNLLTLIRGGQLEEGYDGYASCPLTTAYGKVIMAEFIYGGKVTPTLPLDPRREYWINWWIKVTGLPLFYWHYMLRGHDRFLPHRTDYVEPAALA